MAITRVRKQGNSLYLCIPALFAARGNIRHGDNFRIVKDALLPNVYTLEKLDNGD